MPAAQKKTATTGSPRSSSGFSAEERAAMKEYAAELKTSRSRANKADKAVQEAKDVVAKIAEMSQPDRGLAERIHAIVTKTAPTLAPRLWYGMPAYAKDGKVLCFFQAAEKFKARYSTLGFNDGASLDDGSMWPTAFALTALTKADEKRIAELIKAAVG